MRAGSLPYLLLLIGSGFGFISQCVAAPKPLRVLLVSGGCCHDYDAQKNLIAEGLKARAMIEVDTIQQGGTATDSKIALYENPDWAKGYDVIIHDECFSDVKDPDWARRILKPHQQGLPAVVLHCAMHSYRNGTEEWFKFLGVTSSYHGAHYAHEVLNRDATHPIMRTLGPGWWNPAGELYHIDKLWPTAHPLAASKNQETGVDEVCAWANDYNGTRVFGTTLGHHNETVSLPAYLDLLTRGTLWAAGHLTENYLKPAESQAKKVPMNLAQGKPAKASSTQEGHPARDAFDGSTGTRWCANGPAFNEWLEVELDPKEPVRGITIQWESNQAVYRYKIDGDDGGGWHPLVDGSKNEIKGTTTNLVTVTGLRKLRITFLSAPAGQWGSIHEVTVFGDKMILADLRNREREQERSLAAEVKVPEGFETTIFAKPPAVNYPVFVAAAPDGTVYISSDKNGSIDRSPYHGRVLRARDLDGDGRADEVKAFVANVDSPRGLVWDHDRLYLLHPPHLSAYIDKDGDGIADEEKVLVKNIAFGFKDRPADHTSNGIELGIDGWIYCAIGDFGFLEAEGTDGRKLQCRGGGLVRVRPDGSGLEMMSHGTRNILEVAVSPLLDAFARDNTNDGDGWDVRFHHFGGLSEHGYPSFYKNFRDEFLEPLADYGGGSGCGALFLSEPGFPPIYNDAVYTADWGREWVYRHRPSPNGATFKVDQTEFVRAPRVTDLDVDANSHLYVASWRGATFTFTGEDVGFLARVSPKGYQPEPLPNFTKLESSALVKLLETSSHRRRLEAQRELIRRGFNDEIAGQITRLATDETKPLASRVAAVFALKQSLHGQSTPRLVELLKSPSLREYPLRAMTDNLAELATVPAAPIIATLADANPRVRREAVFSMARLNQKTQAGALIPLLADPDPVVAHTVVQALKQLEGAEVCFSVVDQAGVDEPRRRLALQVLQGLHQAPVVDGVISRLQKESNAARRRGLITTLARLHFTAGVWKGDSWGTRPDTSGPYYQPVTWDQTDKIAVALQVALNQAQGDESVFVASELARHKVQSADTLTVLIKRAATEEALLLPLLSQLARTTAAIPPQAQSLLYQALANVKLPVGTRSLALTASAKLGSPSGVVAILAALPAMQSAHPTDKDLRAAVNAWLTSPALDQHTLVLEVAAAKLDASAPWADAALLNLTQRKTVAPAAKSVAQQSLDSGWTQTARKAQILRAIALSENRGAKDRVLSAEPDQNPVVAAAFAEAARVLRLDLTAAKKALADQGPKIETLKLPEVMSALQTMKGDRKLGEDVFTRLSCVNCHTVDQAQALRGPYLGNIATIYKRPELAEAILVPNKTIAQGFATHQFELKDGTEIEGFVTLEAADKVTVRNVLAQEITILIKDIAKREKVEKSLMPEGLVASLTVKELASLLDYLEGLSKK